MITKNNSTSKTKFLKIYSAEENIYFQILFIVHEI